MTPLPAKPKSAPVAISIAGSDSGGAAGIQADLLAFAAIGAYGTTVATCLTAQNPDGVTQIEPLSPTFVIEQAKQVFAYYHPLALKTGMLLDAAIVNAVASFIADLPGLHIVVDPVMVATSGKELLSPEANNSVKKRLCPLASIVTPNLDEAQILYGKPISTVADMSAAAASLAIEYDSFILLKGGHLESDVLTDVIAHPSGEIELRSQSRIQKIDTHGSGCTLSAAITAFLAKGRPPLEAIDNALAYLRDGMESPVHLHGRPFINHFPR